MNDVAMRKQQLEITQRSLILALAQVNEALIYSLYNEQNGHYCGEPEAQLYCVREAQSAMRDAEMHLRVGFRVSDTEVARRVLQSYFDDLESADEGVYDVEDVFVYDEVCGAEPVTSAVAAEIRRLYPEYLTKYLASINNED